MATGPISACCILPGQEQIGWVEFFTRPNIRWWSTKVLRLARGPASTRPKHETCYQTYADPEADGRSPRGASQTSLCSLRALDRVAKCRPSRISLTPHPGYNYRPARLKAAPDVSSRCSDS